jgi:hypothetical protein
MSDLSSSFFYTFCIIGSLYYLKYTNPVQYENFQSIIDTSSIQYKYKLSLYKLIQILNQIKLQNTLNIFNLPYFIEAIYKHKNELEETKKLKQQVDTLYNWSQLYKSKRS